MQAPITKDPPMSRVSPRLALAFLVVPLLACAAGGDAPDEGTSADELRGGALAKLPPGKYVVSAVGLANRRVQRVMILTVPAGRAPVTITSSRCPVTEVRADGTFKSPLRTFHTTDTFGDRGWDDHPWVSDGPRASGWSWTCGGKLTFDESGLSLELLETYEAPERFGYVLQGKLGQGSVLLQAAASNGGRFPPGVRSELVNPTWTSVSGLTGWFRLAFFRSADGHRFVADARALEQPVTATATAVELAAPNTHVYVCREDGGTAVAAPPNVDVRLPCGKAMTSAMERDGLIYFQTDPGSTSGQAGHFAKPSWF